MLKDDSRFSKIIVLGHSEGALIGMITCFGTEDVNGFISLAGPGRPADVIMMEQMKSQPPSVLAEFKTITDSLKKGKTVPKVDAALYGIARPSIQPYLMSLIAFDPARVIKKLKLPILVIQGNNDMQMSVNDAQLLKKQRKPL